MRKIYLAILLFFIYAGVNAQSYSYSYIEPCSGKSKSITIPYGQNNIAVDYYGNVNSFNQNDFNSGVFASWMNSIAQLNSSQPCGEITTVLTNNINMAITQNVLSTVMNVTSIAAMAQSMSGLSSSIGSSMSNSLGNTVSNGEGGSGGSKKGKDKNGGNSNGNNSTGVNGGNAGNSTGNNTSSNGQVQGSQGSQGSQVSGSSNPGGSGSNSENTGSTADPGSTGGSGSSTTGGTTAGSSTTGGTTTGSGTTGAGSGTGTPSTGNNTSAPGTNQENSSTVKSGGGSGTANSISNAEDNSSGGNGGNKNAGGSKAKTGSMIGSGDIVALKSAEDPNAKNQFKFTGSLTHANTNNTRVTGILGNFTTEINNINLTVYKAWVIPESQWTIIAANSTMMNFEKDAFNTTTLLGSKRFKGNWKKLTAMGGLNFTAGKFGEKKFYNLSAVGGGFYSFNISKKVSGSILCLAVYSPFTQFYEGQWWSSSILMVPFSSWDYSITKTFKFNVSFSGVYELNKNFMNYQILTGGKILL